MLKSFTFAAAAIALAMSATPAFAQCTGKKQDAAARSSGYQTIGWHNTATQTRTAARGDIVDVAVGAGQFGTLVAAVQAAGLVDTLKGPGPFTVFAPTDAAFAKLPAGTVANLLKPENRAQLVQILTYHVVPGRIAAAQLAGRTSQATTVEGRSVSVDGRVGVRVNGATVVQADVGASNGIIHVIDTVLLPPARHASR
jgi:uncharacterized surface protein with fasciclin (FAS1) repeats